jgi:hypothetical protein
MVRPLPGPAPGQQPALQLRYERSDWRSHREAYGGEISRVRDWAKAADGSIYSIRQEAIAHPTFKEVTRK